jgi:hypothetical protein
MRRRALWTRTLLVTSMVGVMLQPSINWICVACLQEVFAADRLVGRALLPAVRIMNAVRAHAQAQANHKVPVFSPWEVLLGDSNPNTFIDNRTAPPQGLGLVPASRANSLTIH